MNNKKKLIKGKLSSCNKKGTQTYRPYIKIDNLEHKDKINNSIKRRFRKVNPDIDSLCKKFNDLQKDKIKLLKDEKVLSSKLNRFKEKRKGSLITTTAYYQLKDNSITKKDLKKKYYVYKKNSSTKREFHTDDNLTIDIDNPKKLCTYGLVRTPNHNKNRLNINDHNYSYCFSDRNKTIFHSSKKNKVIKKYNANNSIIINVNNTSIYFQENKIKNNIPIYSSRNFKQNINSKCENNGKFNIDMFSSYAMTKLGKLPNTNSKDFKQDDFCTNFKKYKNNVKTKVLKTEEIKNEKKEFSNDENNDFNFSFGPLINKKQENLDIDNGQKIINEKMNKESIIIPDEKENIFEDLGCNKKNDESLNINNNDDYINSEKEEENYKMKKKIYLYEKHKEEIMERYNKKFKGHLHSDNLSSKTKLGNHLNTSSIGKCKNNTTKNSKRIIVLRVKRK